MRTRKTLLNRYALEQDSSAEFLRDYSIAALLCCDPVLATTQEERFTWKKRDSPFPLDPSELSAADHYQNLVSTFDMAFESLLSVSPLPQDNSPKDFTSLPSLTFRIRETMAEAMDSGGTVI